MRAIFTSPYKNIFILSLLVYLTTSWFSEGYYHPDEHFQILEFCNYKLGKTSAADLPWEFRERIRPALQPALAWSIIKVLNFAGIYNPFTYTLIFRILTALFAWFIVCKSCLVLLRDFSSDTGKKIFLFMNFFLWFIPSISVRFSSENFSALAFLSAVYLVLRCSDDISKKNLLKLSFAGLLLGFSFFFRFQTGFAILGLGLWLVLIKKIPWRNLFPLLVSGLCAIAFCIYIDFWFYGEFELTPVNYFFANIIENKAADWGTSPWWYYFYFFILQAIPPISLLLLVFFFMGAYRKPTTIFFWCLIPFLIAHFVTGHKEMRFLFPMVYSFIYLAAIGIDHFIIAKKYKKAGRFLFVLSIIINVPLLIFKMVTPAKEAVNYYKFLYNYSPKKEIVLFCSEKNVYELAGLKANFYQSANVRCIVVSNGEFPDYLNKYKPDSVFLLKRNLSADSKFAGYQTESMYCMFPEWILRFNFNNWQSRAQIWNIQKIRKTKE